jgi:hypothetical protein
MWLLILIGGILVVSVLGGTDTDTTVSVLEIPTGYDPPTETAVITGPEVTETGFTPQADTVESVFKKDTSHRYIEINEMDASYLND